MSAVPESVLMALDVLNGHARAHGCGKRAIYAYKSLAALMMVKAGEMGVRRVEVVANCLTCGGSGLWRDWQSYRGESVVYHEPCRKCGRTGKVKLQFAETSGGGRTWHHPVGQRGFELIREGLRIASWKYPNEGPAICVLEDGTEIPEIWESAGEWLPNQPGKVLEPDRAAEMLCIVEHWVLTGERCTGQLGWFRDTALREMKNYSLKLKRLDEPCWQCGSEPATHHYAGTGRDLGRLDFSRCVCDACAEIKPTVWPTEPSPAMLTPAVVRWREVRATWAPMEPAMDWY